MHPKVGIPKHMAISSISLQPTHLSVIVASNGTNGNDSYKIYNLDNEGSPINCLKSAPLVTILYFIRIADVSLVLAIRIVILWHYVHIFMLYLIILFTGISIIINNQ